MRNRRRASAGKHLPEKRRTRRSAEEIIDRLIDAAVEEFRLKGYAGARTAAIAQRAGVVEPLLFKHFGSKANLFQRAIFANLDRHYMEFVEAHSFDEANRDEWIKQAREYIGEQQDFLRKHARTFMSLVIHETYDSEIEDINGLSGLQKYLDKMSEYSESGFTEKSPIHPKLIARISFAALLSCVLFRDWLFPKGIAADEEIKTAVIDFILKGASLDGAAADRP